jgi:phage-related protein
MTSIFTVNDWLLAEDYQKNEIVKKDGLYYYALRDIPSNTSFSTTYWGGVAQLNAVTFKPEFIWKPSYNSPADHSPKVRSIQFADGYEQRIPDGLNNNLLILNLTFELRDLPEAAAILHFLHTRKGSESFVFTPPAPYAERKKFICKDWSHNEVFFNNHSIRAKFEERVV